MTEKQGRPVDCRRVEIEQIDPMTCQYRYRGERLAYLSRGRLRKIAQRFDLPADGVKLEIYNRLIRHLEETGAPDDLKLKGKAV